MRICGDPLGNSRFDHAGISLVYMLDSLLVAQPAIYKRVLYFFPGEQPDISGVSPAPVLDVLPAIFACALLLVLDARRTTLGLSLAPVLGAQHTVFEQTSADALYVARDAQFPICEPYPDCVSSAPRAITYFASCRFPSHVAGGRQPPRRAGSAIGRIGTVCRQFPQPATPARAGRWS